MQSSRIFKLDWSNSAHFDPALTYYFLDIKDIFSIIESSSEHSHFRIESISVLHSSNIFKQAQRNSTNHESSIYISH